MTLPICLTFRKGRALKILKSYVGTKIIQGEPEEKEGEPGYKVVYPDGYVSWSPKVVFENAYREITPGEFDLIFPKKEGE